VWFDLGLDEPFYRQFGIWMSQLLQGDLGTSIFSGLPVTQLIAQRFEPTLALTILTIAMRLSILPVQGYMQLSQGLLPFLKHLILPALTLGLVYTALIAWMTRASMDELCGAWGTALDQHRSGGDQSGRSSSVTVFGTLVWDRSSRA